MKKTSRMQLKNIRKLLKEKKIRDFENIFVAEGEKIVRDMLLKGHTLDSVFVSSSFAKKKDARKLLLDLDKREIPVFEAGDAEFDRLSSLQHSQGILSVVKKPAGPKRPYPKGKNALAVLCDGIQDPGNLGTIIRTSAAMGADLVMLFGECADVFNPKVVRASSGTILDIPVVKCNAGEVDRMKQKGYQLLVSHLERKKGQDITTIKKIPARCIVVFGSEGKGVSKKILERADKFFYIPISKKIESLNVTSAAAITLYAVRYTLNAGK